MKKIQLILPVVAFLMAGIGVFATELSKDDVVVIEQRVVSTTNPTSTTPCDLAITESCPGGSVACTYTTAGAHFGKQVYLFNSNVSPSTCTEQTKQP